MNNVKEKLIKLSQENKKSPLEIALKLAEESGEVAEAVLKASNTSGMSYKDDGSDKVNNVLEECVDTIMVAASLFIKLEGTEAQFVSMLKNKCDKWERVTK